MIESLHSSIGNITMSRRTLGYLLEQRYQKQAVINSNVLKSLAEESISPAPKTTVRKRAPKKAAPQPH